MRNELRGKICGFLLFSDALFYLANFSMRKRARITLHAPRVIGNLNSVEPGLLHPPEWNRDTVNRICVSVPGRAGTGAVLQLLCRHLFRDTRHNVAPGACRAPGSNSIAATFPAHLPGSQPFPRREKASSCPAESLFRAALWERDLSSGSQRNARRSFPL